MSTSFQCISAVKTDFIWTSNTGEKGCPVSGGHYREYSRKYKHNQQRGNPKGNTVWLAFMPGSSLTWNYSGIVLLIEVIYS